MLSLFGAVLVRPGARALSAACLLGWFSAIGTSLAVVLAVHRATGSFALAGAASAIQAIGSAVLAPFRGRLVGHNPGDQLDISPAHGRQHAWDRGAREGRAERRAFR